MGRGIDIERVNIVINYDMPETGAPRRAAPRRAALCAVCSACCAALGWLECSMPACLPVPFAGELALARGCPACPAASAGICWSRSSLARWPRLPAHLTQARPAPADEKHGNGADTYLHRVGRAGRFGTKGLAITFVASPADSEVLNQVQVRCAVVC